MWKSRKRYISNDNNTWRRLRWHDSGSFRFTGNSFQRDLTSVGRFEMSFHVDQRFEGRPTNGTIFAGVRRFEEASWNCDVILVGPRLFPHAFDNVYQVLAALFSCSHKRSLETMTCSISLSINNIKREDFSCNFKMISFGI